MAKLLLKQTPAFLSFLFGTVNPLPGNSCNLLFNVSFFIEFFIFHSPRHPAGATF